MALSYSERSIDTPVGRRNLLVITPTAHILVNTTTTAASDVGSMSEVDLQILDQARIRAAKTAPTVCIFRGQHPEGLGSYQFNAQMTEEQAVEVAGRLLVGQIVVYREMIRSGICLFIHVEFGPLAVAAFRAASADRIEMLERRVKETAEATAADQVDLWLLRNLNFFLTLGFEKLVDTILPGKLALMEKRMDRIQRLVATLPRAC